jgi:2-polyprenyl-3-methyl-5-hydroxy-6-metoxy-1,4-benzoquinol methylase
MTAPAHIAAGKPAEFGQELLNRRARICRGRMSFANQRVLDYGCGNGAQSLFFADDAAALLGIDISAESIAEFQEHIPGALSDTVMAAVFDGATIPAPDASFDTVTCFEVLEHVADEQRTLYEIARVLKPGGTFLLTVPNKGWIFETHGAALPLLPWNRVPFFSWLPSSLHRRFARARIYRRRDILDLLQTAGFRIEHASYVTAPLDVLHIPWLQKLFRRSLFRNDTTSFSILATAIFVHCTAPEAK